MNAELMLDVGQANEFKLACRRAGYTNADIKRMCEGDMLAKLLPAIRGNGEVVVKRRIIDCTADPLTPQGWEVVEHKKQDWFEWDPSKISLYLSPSQMEGKGIRGSKLRKELKGEPMLNASALDYFLANPSIIPDEWKMDAKGCIRYIFFWGTIYRDANGRLCVRYFFFDGSGWCWSFASLSTDRGINGPGARLAI